ncbi:MAG TPA: glycosyltransferase family 9 protein [Bacteroidia bacterium]|jgi:ADP-heptose:LPS heptosyltransferase|nr:glycosyltransferase family 9 protein [Bacteroidia bacterium]
MLDIKSVKFDCKHFRGDLPCKPNKLRGKRCTCDEYIQVSHRILIIKLGALGDVIRSTALLVRYRKLYPNAHITWLTHSPEILPHDGSIDVIAKFEYKNILPLFSKEFDIAINLDKDAEACTLLSTVKAKKKHGFTLENGHLAGCNAASERKIVTGLFDEDSKSNTLSYPQEIFDICELKFEKEEPLLNVNKELVEKWTVLKQKASDKKIIGLNTGCGKRWLTRLWPDLYWQELIYDLQKEGYFPILLGGPDEDAKNRRYAEITGAYYPGTFSLEEFIALTANCDVVVSAVSMMMHISIGLKRPLVLFNNIFNKHEFEMYGRGIIVEPTSGCDDFYGNTCTREKCCMNDLPVKDVFAAIQKLA